MGKLYFLSRIEALSAGPPEGWLVGIVILGFGGAVAFVWWLGKQ